MLVRPPMTTSRLYLTLIPKSVLLPKPRTDGASLIWYADWVHSNLGAHMTRNKENWPDTRERSTPVAPAEYRCYSIEKPAEQGWLSDSWEYKHAGVTLHMLMSVNTLEVVYRHSPVSVIGTCRLSPKVSLIDCSHTSSVGYDQSAVSMPTRVSRLFCSKVMPKAEKVHSESGCYR
jgi:hypothetical protein